MKHIFLLFVYPATLLYLLFLIIFGGVFNVLYIYI